MTLLRPISVALRAVAVALALLAAPAAGLPMVANASGGYDYDSGEPVARTVELRSVGGEHRASERPTSRGHATGDRVHLRPSHDLVAPRTPGNDFQVVDSRNPGRTITDIDTFRPGELVELKSATSAADPQAWIQKHVVRKTESYLEARQHIPGWEQADIAFEFTKPGVDPAFVRSVNEAVTGLDATTPGVNISVRWAP